MKKEAMENSEAILNRLFNPQKHGGRNEYSQKLKYRYLTSFLYNHWQEIVGETLAENCRPEKIERSLLYVMTDSNILANNLYMMKAEFLQRVNKILEGKKVLNDIRFRSTALPINKFKQISNFAVAEAEKITSKKCPVCGSKMNAKDNLCSICERAEKQKTITKITALLQEQPWLNEEKIMQYFPKCDIILIREIRSKAAEFYYEKVRLKQASEAEELMAVLFLTEKEPAAINEQQVKGVLRYLQGK